MNEVNQAQQQVWDIKKVTIFAIVLLALGAGLMYKFKDQKFLPQGEVRGTQAQKQEKPNVEVPSFADLQTTFEEKLVDIREDAENINVEEVASSSPQIQKVINDIKNLQNYPRSQAKEACFSICENL